MWDESGRVIEERSLEMARPFPMAVGGHLRSASFDRNASTLTLNVTVAAGAPANASSTVVFVSLGLYFPRGFSAAVTAQPADAAASIALPCFAGAGAGGTHVDPPGMGCAPAAPPSTPGAPPPFAYGYAVLSLMSPSGGDVTFVVTGRP